MINRLVFLAALTGALIASAADDGFRPLFDGKSLAGWDGDPRLWKIVDGSIMGTTDDVKIDNNSFLIYRVSEFGNFHLRAKVKLRNHNSGIQFRSEALPNWVVKGYQADMAENAWWGSIYDEKGTRGVMVNGWKDKAEKVVKATDWNQVEVRCEGDNLQVFVNGMLTADLRDSVKTRGILALQLHTGPGMQVQFREIEIKELK
jgi:hypothetical protein